MQIRIGSCLSKMKGRVNWYAIWFALFVLLLYMHIALPYDIHTTMEEQMVTMVIVAVGAVLFSNGLGLVSAFCWLYDGFSDLWMLHFNENQWLVSHGTGIGPHGFSYEKIVEGDITDVVLGLFVILNLLFSAKRCKQIGVSMWWALVPLYNPIALLVKISNLFPQEE